MLLAFLPGAVARCAWRRFAGSHHFDDDLVIEVRRSADEAGVRVEGWQAADVGLVAHDISPGVGAPVDAVAADPLVLVDGDEERCVGN
jgi:hypothetical protein